MLSERAGPKKEAPSTGGHRVEGREQPSNTPSLAESDVAVKRAEIAHAIVRAHLDRILPIPRGIELAVLAGAAEDVRGRMSPLEQLARLTAIALRCEQPPPAELVIAAWLGRDPITEMVRWEQDASAFMRGLEAAT